VAASARQHRMTNYKLLVLGLTLYLNYPFDHLIFFKVKSDPQEGAPALAVKLQEESISES